jgi:hypothetical protein
MSTLFGGSDNSAANAARLNQQAQQAQIAQGEKAITNIFGGGSYGVGTPAQNYYTPGTQYYDVAGQPYTFNANDPMYQNWAQNTANKQQYLTDTPQYIYKPASYTPAPSGSGIQPGPISKPPQGNPSGVTYNPPTGQIKNPVQEEYLNYLIRSGQLFSGTQTTPGFNQDFYNNITQQYLNYAMPQIENQYQTAANQVAYKLADQGLAAGGTARDYLTGQLQKTMSDAQQQVYNQGLSLSQSTQQQVGQQENNLINQLIAGASPALTTQQALNAATQFRAPTALPAVGNLFGTFANTYLASQLSNPSLSNPYLLNPYLYRAPSTGSLGSSYSITP